MQNAKYYYCVSIVCVCWQNFFFKHVLLNSKLHLSLTTFDETFSSFHIFFFIFDSNVTVPFGKPSNVRHDASTICSEFSAFSVGSDELLQAVSDVVCDRFVLLQTK